MEPIIEFQDFSFQYRSQVEPTLKHIDLKIYPGEKILVAGQSGSGKSTLAHCINALIPCSYAGEVNGTLRVSGADPSKLGVFGMSQKVGTVLQDTDGQFIGLTVAEDMAFALENEGVSQQEMFTRVQEAAETVHMTDYLEHAPSELSGGQKQRVSLGGVLVDDVDILLFDEPLANLDPATGKHTIALIDEIMKRKDVTVLIIEHRLEDVLYRDVDRIIVMGDGQVVADLHPDELLCSDVLQEQGIREPLYITALKHAGCKLKPEDHPQHLESMDLHRHATRLQQWFQEIPLPAKEPEADVVLEVKDVNFAYTPEEPILRDVNFSIHKGEMVALVGKNGAGKSTLASVICGFYKQQSGQVLLHGQDLVDMSIKERGEHIGYVMQSPNQMISKPMIREEVGLGLAVRGVPEAEIKERVGKTLKICGLYPYRNWPVSALSFGQKKRVSIASILVMQPEILILDEPTAGQDYAHYTEIMEFLKMLQQEMGLTILMITHDMHLMLEYTDRALVLTDGCLLKDATPAEVLSDSTLSERAFLKRTSLYDLAVACHIPEATDFIGGFIRYERENRRREEHSHV